MIRAGSGRHAPMMPIRGALILLATHDGPYRINETPVTRAELVAAVLPMLVLFTAACITGGVAAWALWRDRVGSRPILALLRGELVAGDVYTIVLGNRWPSPDGLQTGYIPSILLVVLLAGLAYWYLFRKSAVVEYYESLRTQ
jgi:hypothetical protein